MVRRTQCLGWAAALLSALALFSVSLRAQPADEVPADLENVGVTQKLNAQVPLDLQFTDQEGREVRLDSYFEGDRPVLLTLVYYRCPMLCGLVLNGLVDALKGIDWMPGDEFEVVTVSIDPLETPKLARHKQQSYLEIYGKPEAARGWHFLTGRPEAIEALADAVGFRYQYVSDRQEYAHTAVLIVLTPEGRVSRYLSGIQHDPRTVRLSLVEASEGKIGSLVDQFLLYCYSYDDTSGQYTPVAWKIMRFGGILSVVVLGSVVLAFLLKEARQKRADQ